MNFKTNLTINPRYWTAMSLASIGGANMGDFFADELHLGTLRGLPILASLFATVAVRDRIGQGAGELWYWLAILVVRTAATNLADSAITDARLSYVTVISSVTVLLAAILIARRSLRRDARENGALRADGSYWLAMLTAGMLGTVLADGTAHIVKPITVGMPISAVVTTQALAIVFGLRSRFTLVSGRTYWLVVVAIRAWGTNVGDISAYFLSRPVSMLLSLVLLTSLLVIWRKPRESAFPATV